MTREGGKAGEYSGTKASVEQSVENYPGVSHAIWKEKNLILFNFSNQNVRNVYVFIGLKQGRISS